MNYLSRTYNFVVNSLNRKVFQRNYIVQEYPAMNYLVQEQIHSFNNQNDIQTQTDQKCINNMRLEAENFVLLKHDLNQARLDLINWKTKYENMSNDHKKLCNQLNEFNELSRKFQDAKEELDDMSRKVKKFKDLYRKEKEEKLESEEHLKRINKQLVKDRDEQFRRYDEQIEILKKDTNQRVSETDRRNKAEIDNLTVELNNAKRKNIELESALSIAKARSSGEETELVRNERRAQNLGLLKLESELANSKKKIEEQFKQIQDLHQQLDQESRKFYNDNQISELEKRELNRMLTEARQRIADLQNLNDQHLGKTGELLLENNILKEKLNTLGGTVNNLTVIDSQRNPRYAGIPIPTKKNSTNSGFTFPAN